MAMSRGELASEIAGTVPELLTAAGIETIDELGDLKQPLDRAFRLTGTYADLANAEVEDVNVDGFLTVFTYTTLQRIRMAVLSTWHAKSISSPGVSTQKQQAMEALERLIAEYKISAEPYITVSGDGAWSVTAISTDYLEPALT